MSTEHNPPDSIVVQREVFNQPIGESFTHKDIIVAINGHICFYRKDYVIEPRYIRKLVNRMACLEKTVQSGKTVSILRNESRKQDCSNCAANKSGGIGCIEAFQN